MLAMIINVTKVFFVLVGDGQTVFFIYCFNSILVVFISHASVTILNMKLCTIALHAMKCFASHAR